MAPGLAWPVTRTLLGCGLLALRAIAALNSGADLGTAARDAASAFGVALCLSALPLLALRYRSFRAFSWCFLVISLCALQLSRDRLLG